MIGSMPSRRAIPAATPAITARSGSRRSGIAADAFIDAIFAASIVVAGRRLEPRREQNRPDRRDQQRRGIAEPQVDGIELVEQEHDGAGDGHHPRDKRCPVELPHAHFVPPSKSWMPPATWTSTAERSAREEA